MFGPEDSEMPPGSIWEHKRTGVRAKVNATLGPQVQLMNPSGTKLRWLTKTGFKRDYQKVTLRQ